METIADLQEWLAKKPRRIAITTHQKPDGDAMGSSLGLYHYLLKKGHKVQVVAPTDYPQNLKWIEGSESVIIGPDDPDAANWAFLGADVIFCSDFNALHRINEFGEIVRESEAYKVMIDHHLEPEGFEDVRIWDTEASSAAEMVFRMIEAFGDLDELTPEIATALYTGIMTDTGSFRHPNTSPGVHRIVAKLMENEVNVTAIHDDIFGNSSENRLRFLGHCFSECLTILPELRTAYILVAKEVFKKFNIKSGETEGLVNYALEIRGINLGILITENDELVKLSFRSRGGFAANEFAKNFDGGGHFNAAGGKSKLSLAETEEKLVDLLRTNKEKLEYA
ncbi:MAG: bifunctional oligoribonuclease/PAP phosphatase NrnA [Bacteroidota bacterium]